MENKAEAVAPLCPCPASIRRKAEKFFTDRAIKKKRQKKIFH